MNQSISFSTYTPAADIVVMAICLVMLVLIFFSYVSRSRSFKLFQTMVGLVFFAAAADISFYFLAVIPEYQSLANWIRCLYHALLLLIFVYYIAYICEVTDYEKQRLYLPFANLVFAIAMAADIFVTSQGQTFIVDNKGIHFIRRGIFIYACLCDMIICLVLLSNVRKLLFRRILFGFYGTIAISFLVLIIQALRNQTSYTVASLLLPVIAMMYVLHSNPYDALLGSNDAKAMQDYVQYCYRKKLDFIFMSLYMKEFDGEDKEISPDMQAQIRQFTYTLAKKAGLFKVAKGHMILIFLTKQYPDYEQKINEILEGFYPLYEKFRYDYKIVFGRSIDEISRKNDYVGCIQNIHRIMPECSVHRVNTEDISAFNRSVQILNELTDIYRQENLDDPRVLVYCQPVLNVRNGKYDTAESLMRLNLEELGIIQPEEFIYLAEEQGYIHVLTRIILNKTSKAVRHFTDAGLAVRLISINISAIELKNDNFCDDIISIIRDSGISSSKIAIELTESQNEGDFMLMKQRIGELKNQGIKIYLDDFGTGYSNMERIMALPFDTIKFDRSLVIASGKEERSRKIVNNLANLFAEMDYSVLYEGIETDADEEMCRGMSAAYLQGFMYSHPVPIMELKNYLSL